MAITIGTKIRHGDHKYEIVGPINDGGMGDVFLGIRTEPTHCEVAVKVPKDHITAHPIWRRKFAREARILANVDHPNVVKIIAFWEFSG